MATKHHAVSHEIISDTRLGAKLFPFYTLAGLRRGRNCPRLEAAERVTGLAPHLASQYHTDRPGDENDRCSASKSSEQAQTFLFAHAFMHGHFYPRRYQMPATAYRAIRFDAFNDWRWETCARPVSLRGWAGKAKQLLL